jgi:hypothetical protein
VRIALKGFTKEWEVFEKFVVGREHLLDWSRLWDDFTQEKIQEGAVDIREMELVKRMLLLLQRARGRRKEISGGT